MKKDYFFNLFQQLITSAVGCLLTLHLSRVFSLNHYGQFIYFSSLIDLCFLFSTFGLNAYGSKVYLEHKSLSPYSAILTVQMFSMSVVLVIVSILVSVMNLTTYMSLIIITNIILLSLQPWWYNIANDKIILNSKILIFSQIIKFMLIMFLVRDDGDFEILFGIIVGVNFIRIILLKAVIPEKYVPKKKYVSLSIIKEYMVMFLPYVCISIYTSMDKIMLANLAGFNELAVYNAGIVVLKTSLIVITSMMPIIIVENTKKIKHTDKNLNKVLIPTVYVSFILMGIFISTGKNIVELLFVEKYYMSSYVIIYGSIIIPLMGVSFMIVGSHIIPKGRNDIFLKSTIFAAICNIIFNFVFIPNGGALGATISTVLAEFIAIVVMFFYIWNILEKIKLFKNIAIAIAINVIAIIIGSNIKIDIIILNIGFKVVLSIAINILLIYLIYIIKKEEVK